MLPPDGGDPDTIESGAAALRTAASGVSHLAAGFRQGTSQALGCGDPTLVAALNRYAAAAEATASALHTQTSAAAQLAGNAAADLTTAGGH